jgi:hypothetical protein
VLPTSQVSVANPTQSMLTLFMVSPQYVFTESTHDSVVGTLCFQVHIRTCPTCCGEHTELHSHIHHPLSLGVIVRKDTLSQLTHPFSSSFSQWCPRTWQWRKFTLLLSSQGWWWGGLCSRHESIKQS